MCVFFQLMMVGYLLDTVETYLPKDMRKIVNKYAACQDAAAEDVFTQSNDVLHKLDACLKNTDYVKYDVDVFYGVQ